MSACVKWLVDQAVWFVTVYAFVFNLYPEYCQKDLCLNSPCMHSDGVSQLMLKVSCEIIACSVRKQVLRLSRRASWGRPWGRSWWVAVLKQSSWCSQGVTVGHDGGLGALEPWAVHALGTGHFSTLLLFATGRISGCVWCCRHWVCKKQHLPLHGTPGPYGVMVCQRRLLDVPRATW